MEKAPCLVKTGLLATLEWGLNQALKLDPYQAEAFAFMDEKVIQLTLTDLKQTCFLIYYQDEPKFILQSHLMGAADAHLKAPLSAWTQQDAQAIKISGDEPLGQQLVQALFHFELDWEEMLSQFTGDLLAHQIGRQIRQAKRQSQKLKQQAGDTLKEYLQFEIELVPTQQQVQHFNQQVNQLADDLAALEAKIEQLKP